MFGRSGLRERVGALEFANLKRIGDATDCFRAVKGVMERVKALENENRARVDDVISCLKELSKMVTCVGHLQVTVMALQDIEKNKALADEKEEADACNEAYRRNPRMK